MRKLLFVALISLAGCADRTLDGVNDCGIPSGTYVKSVLDGRVGMVIRAYLNVRYVEVRFAAQSATTDSRLGPDGAIETSPYSEVTMRCFEVVRADP